MFRLVSLLLLGLCVVGHAVAQDYPSRPVTIVVPQGPGAADLPFRIIAPAMAKRLGQPVIVENREGAATLIGSNYVAHQASADGYTVAGISVNALITLPLAMKNIGLDPLKDLPPIINVAASPLVLVASAREPFRNFGEMIDYAKANPGKLNYATSSPTTRLMTELFLRKRGAEVTPVPYKTTAGAVLGLTEDEVQLGITLAGLIPAQAAKLRVLAQTGDRRSKQFPDVPTFAELGFPQIPGAIYSLNVQAGTPQPIVDRLYDAVSYALQQPEITTQLEQIGMEIMPPASPDEVRKSQAEIARGFTDTAHEIGLQPQ